MYPKVIGEKEGDGQDLGSNGVHEGLLIHLCPLLSMPFQNTTSDSPLGTQELQGVSEQTQVNFTLNILQIRKGCLSFMLSTDLINSTEIEIISYYYAVFSTAHCLDITG